LAFSNDGFDKAVALPPGLTIAHLRNAIEFVEEKAEELIDLYLEQAISSVRLLESWVLERSIPSALTSGTNTPTSRSSVSPTYP